MELLYVALDWSRRGQIYKLTPADAVLIYFLNKAELKITATERNYIAKKVFIKFLTTYIYS